MSREGRSQPIQPVVRHGFLGNVPANGTLPGRTVVCETDDRRSRTPPLQPVVLNGLYATVTTPTAAPPAPTVAATLDRARPATAPPAIAEHGFVDSGVGAPGTAPPAPVNTDRADQRARYKPLNPTVLVGVPTDQFGASVLPAGPFVVPLDERRRFLQAIPAATLRGYDDPTPPDPTVVEPDDRRRRNRAGLDPVTLLGVPADQFVPFVKPPPTLVVFAPLDRRHYRPPDPLWISSVIGATIPFVPPPVVTVLAGTDWAAEISSW